MPYYDYRCENSHEFELRCSISAKPEAPECPTCGAVSRGVITRAPAVPTTIVVAYPGSKKFKAGYVHSHGDRRSEKISVGYGGRNVPRDPEAVRQSADGGIWKNNVD